VADAGAAAVQAAGVTRRRLSGPTAGDGRAVEVGAVHAPVIWGVAVGVDGVSCARLRTRSQPRGTLGSDHIRQPQPAFHRLKVTAMS
jgi:hypothetical protein